MKYLPFEHIVYTTNLSKRDIIKRLSDCMETKGSGFTSNNKSTKEYEGFIDDHHFEMNRIIRNRNSFLPQISGSIQENNNETQIEVKMKLHVFVLIFLVFWCSFILFFLTTILIAVEKISFDVLIPIGMLLFAYALSMFGFKTESMRSKEDLKKIFEAK
ncbi:hypothetical protein [Chryseobacterium sp. SIMBA_029]|uniref:hypothetical protein n=1 Tax=Chryseobacterium sp. SIMBA_029 TaxID=3085772 RepID=UPI00397CCC99